MLAMHPIVLARSLSLPVAMILATAALRTFQVLSVVAQQLMTIQNALRSHSSSFVFEGREIPLVESCGVVITQNPGYAGRSELPDNLKVWILPPSASQAQAVTRLGTRPRARLISCSRCPPFQHVLVVAAIQALFRPVSMMIPDYALVAEVMLFSEGFLQASTLSRKMVMLYKLSSEQLSQQDHYDFGLRALKSVLVMAGALKRQAQKLSEDIVLIRAMRDANIPKVGGAEVLPSFPFALAMALETAFCRTDMASGIIDKPPLHVALPSQFLSEDTDLFNAIVGDLFPGLEIPDQDYGDLKCAVVACSTASDLQPAPSFVLKVVLFHLSDGPFPPSSALASHDPPTGSSTRFEIVFLRSSNCMKRSTYVSG